jgi:hypothetical protein
MAAEDAARVTAEMEAGDLRSALVTLDREARQLGSILPHEAGGLGFPIIPYGPYPTRRPISFRPTISRALRVDRGDLH